MLDMQDVHSIPGISRSKVLQVEADVKDPSGQQLRLYLDYTNSDGGKV